MHSYAKQIIFRDNCGFTIIEFIVVLTIISILGSLAIPKFMDVAENTKVKQVQSAVSNLNAQEKLLWSKIKYSQSGWVDDESLFSEMNTNLGKNYKWNPIARIDGGVLDFKGQMIDLTRIGSTASSPGWWMMAYSSE